MSCTRPVTAYWAKDVNPSGKRSLVFSKTAALSGIPVMMPCGQCVDCRLAHAGGWAARMMKEAQYGFTRHTSGELIRHEVSSFLTLTYDPENLPDGASLVKKDISAFCKRLHNRLLRSRGHGIRFYYSGEYGERYGRPHYHAIIFGFDWPDKKFYKYNKRGEPIYSSEYCRELWPYGRNGSGNVTFESCAYVSGYVVDKVKGDAADEYYWRYDPRDGAEHLVEPEFSGMSRNPGIGRYWFDKYHGETYRDDFLVVNGSSVPAPRYFDVLYDSVDSVRLAKLKSVRRRRALLHKHEQTPERRRIREIVSIRRLEQRGKGL